MVAGIIVGAAALLLLQQATAVNLPGPGRGDEAWVRLSWSARPERVETCRRLTDAELADRPAHMRLRLECTGRFARYRLAVLSDGVPLALDTVRGGGLRNDRPMHVLRELAVDPPEPVIAYRRGRRWMQEFELIPETVLVIVGDERALASLDAAREDMASLADPRRCDEACLEGVVARRKPFYMLHGGLHSMETGSPEMLMELAYRLAVSDAPVVREIRDFGSRLRRGLYSIRTSGSGAAAFGSSFFFASDSGWPTLQLSR